MYRLVISTLLTLLIAVNVSAQSQLSAGGSASTVAIDQTTPGTTNGVYVNTIADNAARLLGQITFSAPQHIICDSGCGTSATVLMADGVSNPTIPQAAAFNTLFNGTTWDRWRGDTTSGAWVNVKNSSLAVTGTFWQSTQPVSIATMPTTAVTGTFWQATQPVSFTPPTLTKATQGSTGYSTQDLKDAGRTLVTLTADNVTPVLTTDTIVTFTKLVGDTSTATQTTYAVTSGKTLRITSIAFSMIPNSTTPAYLRVRLRTLSSGACLASSTLVGVWGVSSPPGTLAANAGGVASVDVPIPDGLEFSGASRNVCLSMNVLGAAAQTVNITVVGFEY